MQHDRFINPSETDMMTSQQYEWLILSARFVDSIHISVRLYNTHRFSQYIIKFKCILKSTDVIEQTGSTTLLYGYKVLVK